jgi:hypothetical protein
VVPGCSNSGTAEARARPYRQPIDAEEIQVEEISPPAAISFLVFNLRKSFSSKPSN